MIAQILKVNVAAIAALAAVSSSLGPVLEEQPKYISQPRSERHSERPAHKQVTMAAPSKESIRKAKSSLALLLALTGNPAAIGGEREAGKQVR